MKFDFQKKQDIILYILEKIEQNHPSISKCVAETYGISTNTVHSYLTELQNNRTIEKIKRGQYRLVTNQYNHILQRNNGELDDDTYALVTYLSKHIEKLPSNIREIWEYAFTEMVNNIIDHSGAENAIISITTSYLKTSVMISDNGIGIFNKIKDFFGLSSLDEAICELFKGKLTTDETNHSGEGIFFTSKMMDNFIIFSENKIFTTDKYNIDENIMALSSGNNKSFINGTCVFMSLSNFSHKTSNEIFDIYSNVDGGFSKTRIPLKNIFESSPVSRSQAKRICNRLDKFKEVILDFDGLTWMGQGFAHQIFVVYQNEHPNIKLTPVNMCEPVENMYNHVTRK